MSCKCESCSSPLRRVLHDHQYVESGLAFVILENCRALVCDNCDSTMVELPNAESLVIAIAEKLVLQPTRMSGESIRFVRKGMGLTADEFALLLGSTRVEVSRWENNRVVMNGLTELRLRLEVLEKLLPPRDDTAALKQDIVVCMTRKFAPDEPQPIIRIDATSHYANLFDVPLPEGRQADRPAIVGT